VHRIEVTEEEGSNCKEGEKEETDGEVEEEPVM